MSQNSPSQARYSLQEASLGGLKPSLSVYLNASKNVQDHVGKNNQVVKGILKDLERIKRLTAPKNHDKRTQHIEKLTFFIVQTLRRIHSDHLMQTTVIWVLINLLRLDFQFSRKVMVSAGVPGVLFDIMSSHVLSGATRQYASELCYFLCSDDPHLDPTKLPDMQGPLGKDIPDVQFTDKIAKLDGSTSLDDGSFLRSIESSFSGVDDRGSLPFVPYVIDSNNMKSLTALFDDQQERFDDGRAVNDQSRHPLLSQSQKSKRQKGHDDDDDDDDTLSTTSEGSISIAAIDMLSQSLGFDHLNSREKLNNGELPRTITGKGKANLFTMKPKALQGQGMQIDMKKKTVRNAYASLKKDGGASVGYGTGAGAVQELVDTKNASNIHNDDYDHMSGMHGFDNMSVGGMSLDSIVSRGDSLVDGNATTGMSVAVRQQPQNMVNNRNDTVSVVSVTSKPTTPHTAPMTARSQQQGVTRFLTSFDPLALTNPGKSANDTIKFQQPDGFRTRPMTSELNDDEDSVHTQSSDEGMSSDDDQDFVDEMKEHLSSPGKEDIKQPKRKQKKLRIRAEKLMDHKFTAALFSKKVSVEETQSLVRRLTDVLELVDTEKSGYVTWSHFSRVISALAPQNMLRHDIDEFLAAQASNSEDLINYREFVISGKVGIIEKINGRSILPINGWLERQKEYVGDATTYTWKNHQAWYNARKRVAIVWLMRRATTALTQEVDILNAARFLFHKGDQAKAIAGLLEIGHKAIEAHRKRGDAKKRILMRCMHARRAVIRREDAFVYLRELAVKVVQTEAILAAKGQEVTYEDVLEEPVDQANISNVFFTYYNHIEARKWLVNRANRALLHSKAQDDAQASVATQAKRYLTQLILKRQAADWLMAAAERYHEYCCVQDNVALALLRIGKHALDYFDRQTAALTWTLQRGVDAENHSVKQDEAGASLVKQAQFKLKILNDRENSVAYLKRRRYNAEALIINKIAAIAFLRGQVSAFEAAGKATGDSTVWLKKRGDRALLHTDRQFKALRRLIYVGGRSKVVHKRATASFIDLHQIGQWARVTNFNERWPKLSNGQNQSRLEEEVDRLKEKLVKIRAERIIELKDKPIESIWEVELHEAFKHLGKNIFMPGETVNDKKSLLDIEREPMMSKIGFIRLMLDGSLLNRSKHEIIQDWHHIDPSGRGFVNFQDVWYWFKEIALNRHRELQISSRGRKKFMFKSQDIISIQDQALFVFKARFALQEKKMAEGKRGDDESEEVSSEEEEEEEEKEESEDEEEDVDPEMSEYDRVFKRLFDQHHDKGGETNEMISDIENESKK
jgi:hypothetical protein